MIMDDDDDDDDGWYISMALALVGVLAIYLRMMGLTRIVTTDIKDDGEVAENILFNSQQNGTPLSHTSLDTVVYRRNYLASL